MTRRAQIMLVVVLFLADVVIAAPDHAVLVFSRTAGFRHACIPAGIAAIREIGAVHGFAVEATEDPSLFAGQSLRRFGVVVFLNTTGDVLDGEQQRAFEAFVRGGGGFVGVHAAADTEYGWDWYGRLVGAYFKSHPAVQQATVRVTDRDHPATALLPDNWVRTDEWYDYRELPGAGVRVLAWLDEQSYEGGTMGERHPIIWCHELEGGRAFYTGGGHTDASFAEPLFRAHLASAILWAARWDDGQGSGALTIDSIESGSAGLRLVEDGDVGRAVVFEKDGAHGCFTTFGFRGCARVSLHVRTEGAGAKLELRADGVGGALLGTARLPATGGWQNVHVDVTAPPERLVRLCVVARTTGPEIAMDRITLHREAAGGAPRPPGSAPPERVPR